MVCGADVNTTDIKKPRYKQGLFHYFAKEGQHGITPDCSFKIRSIVPCVNAAGIKKPGKYFQAFL